MTNLQISDLTERKLALDPAQSFIVQAPAGSGKTSLLVQRYLVLLSQTNTPEEILAITFTRKAAFEMRNRIIGALKKSASNFKARDQYEATTLELAKKALEQDKIKKWNIIQNPNRLRIQTIDAFCHYLVNQVPILSKINANFQIAQNQDVEVYYRKAAGGVLNNLTDPEYSKHLKSLLLHLDNNWQRVENLFVTMLKSREQWLPHVVGVKNIKELRQNMELALKEVAEENIVRCISLFPKKLHQELIELLDFSHSNRENPPAFLQKTKAEGTFINDCLSTWQGIANFLLTKEFSWRKMVTKDHGFPASSNQSNKSEKELFKIMKARMKDLLTKFSEHEQLRQSLENLLLSPPPHYTDQQWEMIDALLELLPLLAAELKLIFNENLITDHSEISVAALFALGDQEIPSELALNLDYRLQHLLLDEFQDTSISQYRLIEKLTTTWEQNDGHTIFIVGDPMQSIYRFREAEVGLFLRAQHEGIGNLKPHPLTLTTNFRSSQKNIDWVNTNFAKVLPVLADINFGAIPFRPSTAVLDKQNSKVELALLENGNNDTESAHVISAIKEIQKQHPKDSVAILVKARTYLQSIITKLSEENLDYQAFELETLRESIVIQDLLSLTRALSDLTDRIAWIAVLRAPWCGLKLEDLHRIANGENEIIWDNICNHQNLELSKDGKERLIKFLNNFTPFFNQRQRLPWQELIEKTWLAIGGPATINSEEELEHAEGYLELIDNNTLDIETLQKKLATLYTPSKSTGKIQIMTIHKAKGLEFDHVIIPGINRTTRFDDRKLMLWFERPKLHQGSDLLLAPIEASGGNDDPIYKYLQLVEQKKGFYETGRLLYVAMTRAKKSIHAFGCIKSSTEKRSFLSNIKPNSLLEQLKACFNESWIKNVKLIADEIVLETSPTKISRFNSKWQNPIAINAPEQSNDPNWELEDKQASVLGTVIHHCLRQISESDLNEWTTGYIKKQHPYWQRLLQQMGYLNIQHGIELIDKAITNTINDERGKWILSKHESGESEFAVTIGVKPKTQGQTLNYIIDRTFVDEDDVRWIIDYKTSMLSFSCLTRESTEKFLQQELEQYSAQLSSYAKAMQKLEPSRKIKTALYFPLFGGWIVEKAP